MEVDQEACCDYVWRNSKVSFSAICVVCKNRDGVGKSPYLSSFSFSLCKVQILSRGLVAWSRTSTSLLPVQTMEYESMKE